MRAGRPAADHRLVTSPLQRHAGPAAQNALIWSIARVQSMAWKPASLSGVASHHLAIPALHIFSYRFLFFANVRANTIRQNGGSNFWVDSLSCWGEKHLV